MSAPPVTATPTDTVSDAAARMQAAGVPAASLDRVHSPMGLELNAETPEEIAVSIMAELIMLRRGGDGKAMSR